MQLVLSERNLYRRVHRYPGSASGRGANQLICDLDRQDHFNAMVFGTVYPSRDVSARDQLHIFGANAHTHGTAWANNLIKPCADRGLKGDFKLFRDDNELISVHRGVE